MEEAFQEMQEDEGINFEKKSDEKKKKSKKNEDREASTLLASAGPGSNILLVFLDSNTFINFILTAPLCFH